MPNMDKALEAIKWLETAASSMADGFADLADALKENGEPVDPPIEPPVDPPEHGTAWDNEVAALQVNPRVVDLRNRADLDSYLQSGPQANDRVTLAIATWDGPDITINSPGTSAAPWVLCARSQDELLKPVVKFKMTINGNHAAVWGLKYSGGRLALRGAVDPIVRRCEFSNWLPDNKGSEPGGHGHAVHFVANGDKGGSGALVERCFLHDPGAYTAAEKAARDGLSDRIFMRIEGKSPGQLHKNGIVNRCMFASTRQRPQPGQYGSGQLDLGECGSEGTRYSDDAEIGWLFQNNIYDGTGQGGPPVGYEGLVLNGDVDSNPSGVLDTKVGGAFYSNNTMRNFQPRAGGPIGRCELRFGRHSMLYGNWLDKATISCQGGYHEIVSNVLRGGGEIMILAGDIGWNEYRDGHQASYMVLLQDNDGNVTVGKVFGDDDNFPVNATRFVGEHLGKLTFGGVANGDYPVHGPYDLTAGGFVHSGAVSYAKGCCEKGATFTGNRAGAGRIARPTGPLGNDQVGPYS